MRSPLSFRARVTALAIGMGLLMSVLFAGAVVLITEHYEHVLVRALLQDQADAWAERLSHDPHAVLPTSGRQRAHLRPLGGSGNIPAHLAKLAPGVHEAEGQRDGLHVGVFDTSAGRIYLEIDLRDVEALERYLLATLLAVVAIGALLSGLLGWWLARSATRPLRRLADAVERLDTTPQATDLAAALPRDELGRVARAIDGYQRRLLTAQDAERAFFADASHELRTPVAVVRGALELLEEDVQSDPRLRAPMRRLRRGVDDTSSLLEALLQLARRQLAPAESVDVDAWTREVIAATVKDRVPAIDVQLEGSAGLQSLPLRDAELIVTALLRRLLATPVSGTLQATLSPQGLSLRFDGDETHAAAPRVSPHDPGARSDRSLGASLIGRLATAHGWRIDIQGAHVIRLHWQGG